MIDGYEALLSAGLGVAIWAFVQLLIADVIGLRRGHIPGHAVACGHDDALFRAVRAVANLNESLAIFVLALVIALGVGADPWWSAACAWVYLAGRIGHGICYYSDWRMARSLAFGISLLGLVGLLGQSAWTLWFA